ncbi:MAG TPA: hypothetical protein VFR67_30980 [Pilimelia sp.]|nr:hypothetical protein [Pilimelia sp.]
MIGRPSTLPAACAPVSAVAAGVIPVAVHESVVGYPTVWRRLSADAPQLPRVHQVSGQAELTQAKVRVNGSYGTNGFTVKGIRVNVKQPVVARGVPPRGRPV